jgi:hypothetical protein
LLTRPASTPITLTQQGLHGGKLMTIASRRQLNGPAQGWLVALKLLWARLTRCEAEGCEERPVHLGWCAQHAPEYCPAPDEYWGDDDCSDAYRDNEGEVDPESDQRCLV